MSIPGTSKRNHQKRHVMHLAGQRTALRNLAIAAAAPLFFFMSSVDAHGPATQPATKPASAAETAQIETVVKALIREHPELIAEALAQHRASIAAKDEEATRETLQSLRAELESADGGFALGPQETEATVTVTGFFDYHCGYCKRATREVFELGNTYDDVRIVFKELPALREESRIASMAALAAREQDKYLVLHKTLMRTPGVLTAERLDLISEQLGLDNEQLKRDMQDPDIARELQDNAALAEAIGLTGTPAFVVGEKLVTGWNNERLTELVEQARSEL